MDHLPVMRRRQLLNDIIHSDEPAIIVILNCGLQPTGIYSKLALSVYTKYQQI